MKKTGFWFWSVFLVLIFSGTPLKAQQTSDVSERLANGVINWSQGVVTAKGSGAPFHVPRYIDGINLNFRNVRGGSLDVEEATTFTIFQEENATLAVDQLPAPRKDLALHSGSQQFGTIHGRIKYSSGKPVVKGSMVLWAGVQGKIIPFENGIYSLMGLEDGIYRVTIRVDGYGEAEKNLQAKKGAVKEVDLVISPRGISPSSPAPPSKNAPRTRP